MSNTRAIFPGTFDPFTWGHYDVVQKAAELFDEVVVAVTDGNQLKQPHLALTNRCALIEQSCQSLDNVQVKVFTGLLVDFVIVQQAQWVVRSARSGAEFDHELQQAWANQLLQPKCQTVLILPNAQRVSVSSSLIREIAANSGDLSSFVPKCVENAIKEAIGKNVS